MNKIEFALESFKNIQDLIKFTDQKTGAILVIGGLLFTSFIDVAKDFEVIAFNESTIYGIITFISGFLTILSLAVLAYISIYKVLKPKKAINYDNGEYSLFYFDHIANNEKRKLVDSYQNLDENEILKCIIDQKFEVSRILKSKNDSFNDVLTSLFAAIFFFGVYMLSIGQN